MKTHHAKIVFSIDTQNTMRPPVQRQAVRELLSSFGIIFEEGSGAYVHNNGKRVTETNFVLYWTNPQVYKAAKAIADLYEQESILLVDSDKRAHLKYLVAGANERYLGQWTEVDFEVIGDKPYTKIDGKYFVTMKG